LVHNSLIGINVGAIQAPNNTPPVGRGTPLNLFSGYPDMALQCSALPEVRMS
jgi:hypothetical protein